MKLETQRLFIVPLDEQQLASYVLADGSLETNLKLVYQQRDIKERVVRNISLKVLPAVRAAAQKALYDTFWLAVSKQRNITVAELAFKGEPNAEGEIEIGYGIYPDSQNTGFMTEAVAEMIRWAFRQVDVRTILAEMDPANISSRRVLEKNGFVEYNQTAHNISWRLDKRL